MAGRVVVSSSTAESEALKHSFQYLVNSIDTDAVLPGALSSDLITDRQRTECANESDPYKKAETFLGHVQRAVNGNPKKFNDFLDMLQKTSQKEIVSCLRGELSHSSKLAGKNSDEGEQPVVTVPDELIQELADVRFDFVELTCNYEREVKKSPEAKEKFIKFLPRLCKNLKVKDGSFESLFETLVEEGISLFNVHYLKRFSKVFPEDVRTITTELVHTYEQQRQEFMSSTSLSQFKQLFPASATNYRLSNGKVPIKLKLSNVWDKHTIADLEKLVKILGILGSHLHLSKVELGCIEVTWLCTISVAEDIQQMIDTSEIRSSFQTMGVIKILLLGKELVFKSPQRSKTIQEKHLSEYYAGGVASVGLTGAGVGGATGAGIGAVIGGIIGSIVPGPGTAVGLAVGAAIGGGLGATAGGAGAGAVHHAMTKNRKNSATKK